MPRSRTIGVDAVCLYVLPVSQHFPASFEAFLSRIACLLTPWAAAALMNQMNVRHKSTGEAMAAWTVGAGITATPIFTGPLAVGGFLVPSLGHIAGFFMTLNICSWAGRRTAGAASAPRLSFLD